MERISVDVLGAITRTTRGNKHIIVIQDYFSKWMEAIPTPDATAQTIASVLIEHFFTRFGLPRHIHTDQGTPFESELFSELCMLLGIRKTRTTPWSPQSNGMIERLNRTIETLLRQTVEEDQSNWDKQLPIACMAYRSSSHSSTGYPPNMLMLGREIAMPSELMLQTPEIQQENNMHIFVRNLQNTFQTCFKNARQKLGTAAERQKKEYDKKSWKQNLKEKDQVWLFNPTRHVGLSPKLEIKWEKTPYVIMNFISDVIVRIKQCTTGKERVVHIDYLQPVKGPQRSSNEPAPSTSHQDPTISTLENMGLEHLQI